MRAGTGSAPEARPLIRKACQATADEQMRARCLHGKTGVAWKWNRAVVAAVKNAQPLWKSRIKRKWPLQSRFLDPILSESSFPLPGIERQPEGATSSQISHPRTPTSDVVRPVGSSFLVGRTNLLSPSVTLLPVFKVSQITATNAQCIQCKKRVQQKIIDELLCTGYPQGIPAKPIML
jgi:hypothetical protein